MLAGQDDHGLGEHLQADGADQLLLQVLHRGSAAGTGPRAAGRGWPEAKREAHHPQVWWPRRRRRRRRRSRPKKHCARGLLAPLPRVWGPFFCHPTLKIRPRRSCSSCALAALCSSKNKIPFPSCPSLYPAASLSKLQSKDPPLLPLPAPSAQGPTAATQLTADIFSSSTVCAGLGYCLSRTHRHDGNGSQSVPAVRFNRNTRCDTFRGDPGGVMQPLAAASQFVSQRLPLSLLPSERWCLRSAVVSCSLMMSRCNRTFMTDPADLLYTLRMNTWRLVIGYHIHISRFWFFCLRPPVTPVKKKKKILWNFQEISGLK